MRTWIGPGSMPGWRGAVRGLPRHQRVPLVLFHFEERSYAEIARMLGVSLGKIKSDIHRGRETLRKRMVADDETH